MPPFPETHHQRRVPRGWAYPLAVVVVDVVLLLGALAIGLRIPDLRLLDGLPAGSQRDYLSRLGPLSGLSPGFVASILGWDLPREPRPTQFAADPGQGRPAEPRHTDGADVHPPTNDAFGDARPARSLPYKANTTTNGSTRQQGEPSGCAPPVGGTLWYRFTSPEDMGLIADTYGSDHATALAVFGGSSLAQLTEIGCDTHLQGLALVPFPARAGETYFFQVSAPTSDVNVVLGGGNLVFRLARQGITSLESMGAEGQGDAPSDHPAISADGRHIVFRSGAANLDARYALGRACPSPQDCGQLFVRDLVANRTAMVSVSSAGEPGNAPSGFGNRSTWSAISANGRFVAFISLASNLVPGDTNVCPVTVGLTVVAPTPGSCPDVFVHDRDADRDGIYDEDPKDQPGAISTTRVSVSSNGVEGDDGTGSPTISADGRFVAFSSKASNLVPGDVHWCRWREPPYIPYNCADVFVHDRETGTTTRVSVSSDGEPGNADSGIVLGGYGLSRVALSADGRQVAFTSRATNLAPGDGPMCEGSSVTETDPASCSDVFVHDRLTGRTAQISLSSTGAPGDGNSGSATISADGRFVAFASGSSNLVPHDTQMCDVTGTKTIRANCSDIFVRDRDVDADGIFDEPGPISTVIASVNSNGTQGDRGAVFPVISGDGRSVAFVSSSSNLAPGDTNGIADLFLRRPVGGATLLLSVSSEGLTSQTGSVAINTPPGVSADGRTFTWYSKAAMTKNDRSPVEDVFVHRLLWGQG